MGRLITGDFYMMWCQTPVDWFVRPREKRTAALYRRIAGWITRAADLKMTIVVSGPSHAVLKQSVVQEAFKLAGLESGKMRFCRQGDKYDTSNDKPSGTYIGVATNLPIPHSKWKCKCKGPWGDHILRLV